MRNKRAHFFLFSALILLGSSIPSSSIPSSFILGFDKIIHFIEYTVFGILGIRSNYKIFNSVNIFILSFGLVFCVFDEDEQQYFRPLIDNFKGQTQEFQRIMRDLGKFGEKIGEGSTFKVCSEVQQFFHQTYRDHA